MRALTVAAAVVAALGLSACMEVEQTTSVQKQGKYQGKADSNPWDSAPLAYDTAKWTKGDKASWENRIMTRQLGQHEHKRIYQ